jgi:hypothetical protein
MRYKQSIKQILISTRSSWDRPETRPVVRQNFDQVTKCGTLTLGAEVFASDTEKKLVPHTCKVRPGPSCGHRATIQWQRQQWCALPDIPYVGIVFTMPNVLWSIFQQNRPSLPRKDSWKSLTITFSHHFWGCRVLFCFNGNFHVGTFLRRTSSPFSSVREFSMRIS